MKRIILTALVGIVGMAFAYPVHADAIDDQKSQVQQKYDNEKNVENKSYDKDVAQAKANYDGDKQKDKLKELEISHNKKIDDLNDNEKMDLQKLDEKKS